MNKYDYINLVNKIKRYDYEYWTLNAPTITDEEYDKQYALLEKLESLNPSWILTDSPTQCLSTAKNGNNRKLVYRRDIMLSTQKINSVEALKTWMNKTSKAASQFECINPSLYTIEWKYDGESCSLVYIDGILIEASTGKGLQGMDALEHVKHIPTIPQKINAKGRVEVRGEIVCPFNNLSKTGYKTCRMAAAGYLANIVPDSNIGNLLDFYVYYVDIDIHSNDIKPREGAGYDMWHMFEWLKYASDNTFKFDTSTSEIVKVEDIEKEVAYLAKQRSTLHFPTDGLVLKVYDRSTWYLFGATEHHPKYLCAYKFPGVTAITTFRKVEITIGEKTGKYTPVVYFDPVVMNNATYSRCSCGSEAAFAKKNIKVGDKIIVTLANDVLCQIVGKADGI